MKCSLLRVIAGAYHVALNIRCVGLKASRTIGVALIPQHRNLRLVLGASIAWSLCAPSLNAQDAPHGDHNPHHGGVVLMYGLDLHYEVVLSPAGDVQLWLSNGARDDLPASVVSDVAAEIERDGTRQHVDMAISDGGDAWVGKGHAVKAEGATLHLGFVYRGEPASLSFPATSLMGEGRDKLVNDTAHAPAAPPKKPVAPKGHEGHTMPNAHEGHEGHSPGAAGTGSDQP